MKWVCSSLHVVPKSSLTIVLWHTSGASAWKNRSHSLRINSRSISLYSLSEYMNEMKQTERTSLDPSSLETIETSRNFGRNFYLLGMSNVDKNSPVCVTGASGFIATHVVEQLLERGYKVNGTVRDLKDMESKYKYLFDLPNSENLTLFKANLNEDESYDEAVEGCDVVIHTASPYVLTVQDPKKDLVDPAVNGTKNVLNSCKKHSVKQVVLTSSVAAITDSPINDKVYTEEDWNTESNLGRNPYYYSKTLAEKAAWKFVEDLPEEEKMKLVVINPFCVIGPAHNGKLNTSNAIFTKILDGSMGGILNLAWGLVDVRDVARAHVLAFEKENAQGRYIVCNETKTMTEVVEHLRPKYPNFNIPTMNLNSWWGTALTKVMSYTQPSGMGQFIRTNIGRHPQIDHSKIQKELDFEFTDVWKTVDDTCEDVIKCGHVAPKAQ